MDFKLAFKQVISVYIVQNKTVVVLSGNVETSKPFGTTGCCRINCNLPDHLFDVLVHPWR